MMTSEQAVEFTRERLATLRKEAEIERSTAPTHSKWHFELKRIRVSLPILVPTLRQSA